ncbi:MAG: type II secretion system minor pseudopilin GspJ [Aeromonadaceae bacterium]
MSIVKRSPAPPHAPSAGFTLLEVLLALVVFATLSLSAYQVLQGVLKSDEKSRIKVERLATLQRSLALLERDFSQIINRPSRIQGEASSVVFQAARYQMESDDWSVSFVRGGWLNPGAVLPRSQLQKVGYRLREGKLERLSYLYVDPVIGTEPTVTPVLEQVKNFGLRFWNGTEWVEEWSKSSALPAAVEVTLVLEDYGKIRRLFLVAMDSAEKQG